MQMDVHNSYTITLQVIWWNKINAKVRATIKVYKNEFIKL